MSCAVNRCHVINLVGTPGSHEGLVRLSATRCLGCLSLAIRGTACTSTGSVHEGGGRHAAVRIAEIGMVQRGGVRDIMRFCYCDPKRAPGNPGQEKRFARVDDIHMSAVYLCERSGSRTGYRRSYACAGCCTSGPTTCRNLFADEDAGLGSKRFLPEAVDGLAEESAV